MLTTDPKPPRKQKQKEIRPQPAPNGTDRLKTVVRRLPPNLPEEIFWQSVQTWVTDDTVTWRSYHPGKLRTKRVNKEGISSRAYIAFKNETQVATFSREYDGHLFRDKAGNESHAVVEYAPFQKVPAEKKKIDARNNTIDKDDNYLSFLETLKGAAKTESVSLEALIAASQPPPPPTTTPLLEALKAEKSAQKDKETILRNHAHYKDATASASSSKKEEAKKKAVAVAAQAAKQAEPPTPSGKKGKKAATAAQKASLTQVQDGQGPPHGKGLPAGGGSAAPSSAKPPAPAPVSGAGHAPRHRPPKEPHGRSHPGKGDTSVAPVPPVSVPASGPGAALLITVTADNAPPGAPAGGPVPPQSHRKNRPVIGLGRHFESALNGAGVAVAGPAPAGDRKRRDKGGGESTPGPGSGSGAGAGAELTEGGAGRGKRREERQHPPEVVPSILQRPDSGVPDVVVVQRPQSPRGTEGHGEGTVSGAAAGAGGGASGRGGARRGRGKGRGGHRGA